MLKHSVTEGLKNLIRSFWLSITAIFIIFVSLLSVAMMSSIWVVVGYTLKSFDNQSVVYIYIKKDAPATDRLQMEQDLKAQNEVKELIFIDSQRAEEEYKNNPFTSSSYDNLIRAQEQNGNKTKILKESFKVIPSNVNFYTNVEKFASQDKYKSVVSNVDGPKDFINFLQQAYYWTAIIGSALFIVFSAISTLVMVNILRIAIYSRREEIEIMRLVGATNNYIRGPFIAEGILYNFLASIFVFIIFIPMFNFLAPSLSALFNFNIAKDLTELSSSLYISLTITNILGLIIGGFSAMLATQRYLKL